MIQVIIPTYNRPKCIEFLLKDCINVYQGFLFKFAILDSSTNNETKDLLKQSCITEYKRFDSSVPVDEKVISTIMECNEEFYWLLGDRNMVNFTEIEKLILTLPEYDILEISQVCSKRNSKNLQEDFEQNDDLINYIKNRYSHLTYWGASIIRTSKAKELFFSGMMDKYREDIISWWTPAMICEIIANYLKKGVKINILSIYTNLIYSNSDKRDKSWTKGESYFVTTFRVFDKDVYMLPKCFDEVKNDIIRIFRDDFLVTKRYLIYLKQRGVIKLRYVLKYKNDIQDIRGYFSFIFMLACIPNFCIAVPLQVYKFLKGS